MDTHPCCAGGAIASPRKLRRAPARSRPGRAGRKEAPRGSGCPQRDHAPPTKCPQRGRSQPVRGRLTLPLAPGGSSIFMMRMRGGVHVSSQRPAPGPGSRPGGGCGPSGAPPASASGREFPLGHDSKMCRSCSSAPSSLPWRGSPPSEGRRGGSSFLGQVLGDRG